MKKIPRLATVVLTILCFTVFAAGGHAEEAAYNSPEEVNGVVKQVAQQNRGLAKIHELCITPGGRDLILLELGEKESALPAVLVVANMEGNSPIASEAALKLAELLVNDWRDELDRHRYYIVPVGNPDGYAHFFEKPLFKCHRNAGPRNDDSDDAVDEDGPEDLNGDGYITMMRQVHPEGTWLEIEGNPVLMKTADVGKGEIGKYRLFSEGIDNDGDGDINEDGPGGVNPGRNFPHNFKHYTRAGGMWAASEIESRAVMEFAFDHPEIAMVLTFGRSNSLKSVPESSKKAQATQDSYKLPEHFAEDLGIDPETEFPLSELVEMGREFTGIDELTEEMVLQWLGAGAAVNPDRRDLPYWTEISERYNDFIKEAELDGDRLDPPDFAPGCIEEWAYYQYGVPSFSMDFWTLPIVKEEEEKKEGAFTPEEIEGMSNEEFIELGNERISEFLKASGAPAQFTADMVIMGLKSGMMTTKKMAEMMRKMKRQEEAGGADETEQALYDFNSDAFVQWQPYDHPTLGEVEIGGMIPHSELTPPADSVDELLMKQLPFVIELSKLLPIISIENVALERIASDLWRVEAWVSNAGFLPYPTYQGERSRRPTQAIVSIEAGPVNILEGGKRRPAGVLGGSGDSRKTTWILNGNEGARITIRVSTASGGMDERVVELRGGGR